MLEIVQLADVPIRGLWSDIYPYDEDVRAYHDSEGLSNDGAAAFPDSQFSVRLTERELEVTLFHEQDGYATYMRLKNLVGKPIDVIGIYELKLDCSIDAFWLHSRGRIERVRARPNDSEHYKINIEIALLGSWSPLNRLIWEYVDEDTSALFEETPPVSPSLSLMNPYPTWEEYLLEKTNSRLWYWRQRPERFESMYDPDFWSLVVRYLPSGFHSIGENIEWNTQRVLNTVWQDNTLFNARPLTFYALRGLDPDFNVEIIVTRETELGGVETVTIDTDTLDTVLTTETGLGLQVTDILLMGDVEGKAAVLRDGEIVAYCTTAISPYMGASPAYIPNGQHVDFRIDFDYLSVTVEWAALILWRMMA
jgi:hypothetical protein